MYLIIVVFLDAAVIQGYVTYFCGCFVTIESALPFRHLPFQWWD